MKIVIFGIEPWERQAFESLEDAHEIFYESGRLNEAAAGHFSDADIVSTLYSRVSRAGSVGALFSLFICASFSRR
jgi:hypothetical protein